MEIYNPVNPAPIPVDPAPAPPAPPLVENTSPPPAEPVTDQSVGQTVNIQA
ncbi:MAG: hypothetical protein N2442_10080 [Spirochaetes bacterium]|nr:hypothetical protein [Spirochaetota bacterium]